MNTGEKGRTKRDDFIVVSLSQTSAGIFYMQKDIEKRSHEYTIISNCALQSKENSYEKMKKTMKTISI